MRINKYLASASGMSRRSADAAINDGRVQLNGQLASLGDDVSNGDEVSLDGKILILPITTLTVMLNKPVGYVSSRNGQGSRTIYDLLPADYYKLKPAGRLDKDSSGLLIITNDGNLSQQLTHPSHSKTKQYNVTLDRSLQPLHQQMIADHGINLDDGPSRLSLIRLDDTRLIWEVSMSEGRNRQIRRTFAALGYKVVGLHRFSFGQYKLNDLVSGKHRTV